MVDEVIEFTRAYAVWRELVHKTNTPVRREHPDFLLAVTNALVLSFCVGTLSLPKACGAKLFSRGDIARCVSRAWRCMSGAMNIRFQFAVVMLAGWINRHQQAIIDYLTEEKQVLLEQLGGKPNRFSDSQRRRLALKAKEVSRHDLLGIQTMITPDTLRRWLRKLVALKWRP